MLDQRIGIDADKISMPGVGLHLVSAESGDELAHALVVSTNGPGSCNGWAADDVRPRAFLDSARESVTCPGAWRSMRNLVNSGEFGTAIEATYIFEQLVNWYEASGNDKGLDPRYWFNHVIAGVVADRAWVHMDGFFTRRADWIESGPRVPIANAIGEELVHCAEIKGSEAALGSAGDAFGRLDGIFATRNLPGKSQFWLRQILVRFCACCRKPELMRGIASLVQATPGPFGPYAAGTLRSLAALDEGQDPNAIIASIDVGQANWIRQLRGATMND